MKVSALEAGGYDTIYFMDDIAIFSYKFKPYNDNKDVRVFSNAVKTVNQLAKSVENIG